MVGTEPRGRHREVDGLLQCGAAVRVCEPGDRDGDERGNPIFSIPLATAGDGSDVRAGPATRTGAGGTL